MKQDPIFSTIASFKDQLTSFLAMQNHCIRYTQIITGGKKFPKLSFQSQVYTFSPADIFFGKSQNSILHSIANRSGAIAAHHRNSPEEDTGFSFLNCTINGTGRIYLGRAWGPYSRAIYSYCDIDDIITPAGWSDWGHPERQMYVISALIHTLYYIKWDVILKHP